MNPLVQVQRLYVLRNNPSHYIQLHRSLHLSRSLVLLLIALFQQQISRPSIRLPNLVANLQQTMLHSTLTGTFLSMSCLLDFEFISCHFKLVSKFSADTCHLFKTGVFKTA